MKINLSYVLAYYYNAGPGVFDPTIVEWAAERLAWMTSVDQAKQELKEVNEVRVKHGLIPAREIFG